MSGFTKSAKPTTKLRWTCKELLGEIMDALSRTIYKRLSSSNTHEQARARIFDVLREEKEGCKSDLEYVQERWLGVQERFVLVKYEADAKVREIRQAVVAEAEEIERQAEETKRQAEETMAKARVEGLRREREKEKETAGRMKSSNDWIQERTEETKRIDLEKVNEKLAPWEEMELGPFATEEPRRELEAKAKGSGNSEGSRKRRMSLRFPIRWNNPQGLHSGNAGDSERR